MEVAKDNHFFYQSHGCALCKNLTDLRESCCCLDAELIEVTETRLLKRCNLKKGERLCSMHFDKVKHGLIFGLEKSGCCAPFHVGESRGNRLRSVPRTWRHLFDTSSIRERYSPSLQICNRCFKITFDLLLRGEQNIGAASTWDLSPASPSSVLSTGSYTSPKRWLSSFTLHENESSTSGSSLSSSNTRFSSTSSSYLLSLYETHRENLGNPKTIPDSIRRYFKYKASTPYTLPRTTPQTKTKYDSESTDVSEKSVSDAEEKLSRKLDPANIRVLNPKFQTFSPKIPLSSTETPITPSTRQACKLFLAKSSRRESSENEVFSEAMQSDSSFETNSDWESISLSALSDLSADYNELCNSAFANPIQGNEGLLTPRRVSSDSSLSGQSDSAEKLNVSTKSMSIDIQFVVNPLLKRSHLTSQVEMCKSFDSFSTNTDELITRAQNFNELQVLSDNLSSNSESFGRSSDVSSIDTNEILSEKYFKNDRVEPNENSVTEIAECIEEKLDSSNFQIHQPDDETELINQLIHTNLNFIQVFAGTLAQCVINFALIDASQQLPKNNLLKEENSSVKNESRRTGDFLDPTKDALPSGISSVSDIINFSDLQTEKILTDALNNVLEKRRENTSQLKHKSELSFTIPLTQYLSLGLSPNDRRSSVPNYSVTSSSKTVIRWLERKGCYRTVFSVQFKDTIFESGNPHENSNTDHLENHKEDLGDSMTLAFDPLDFRLVECVVDDLIPITRSLSTGFIDKYDDSAQLERSPRLRASSFDSFFTLTCKPTSYIDGLDKQFTAVPVDQLKSRGGESGVFLSTSTVERFCTEDEGTSVHDEVQESDELAAVENISISSGATDFSSSSTLDDCDIIQAELLEKSKISERPHFVSHKSRIEEIDETIPSSVRIPFELKPQLTPFAEEEEEDSDNKSMESFGATVDLESQYEDAFSTTGAAAEGESKLNNLPENNVASTESAKDTKEAASDEQPSNRKRKMSIVSKAGAKTFDWYVGEDIVEQRRSTRLLKVLSDAALFTTKTRKTRRDIRARKTDEDAEDEDVSDVISQALEDYTPKFLLRRYREDTGGSNNRHAKMIFKIVAVVGFVGSLVYAGWKYYS